MESVVVYTGKDLRQMRESAGCGHWTASPIRVEAAEYLVCVRNRREQWAAHDFEHGTAFLIARIKQAVPSVHAARIVITFEAFATIHVPNAWNLLAKGQRFPVAYLETQDLLARLKITPDVLAWSTLNDDPEELSAPASAAAQPVSPHLGPSEPPPGQPSICRPTDFAETLHDAKKALAKALGIPSQKIEITIRL